MSTDYILFILQDCNFGILKMLAPVSHYINDPDFVKVKKDIVKIPYDGHDINVFFNTFKEQRQNNYELINANPLLQKLYDACRKGPQDLVDDLFFDESMREDERKRRSEEIWNDFYKEYPGHIFDLSSLKHSGNPLRAVIDLEDAVVVDVEAIKNLKETHPIERKPIKIVDHVVVLEKMIKQDGTTRNNYIGQMAPTETA